MSGELAAAYVSLHVRSPGIRGEVESAVDGGARGVGAKQGRGIGKRLSGALGKAAKVGAVGAGVVAGAALLGGFKSAISQGDTKKTLAGLYDSTADATDMMGRLKKIAKDSPIDQSAYASGAKSLAYMGLKGEEAEKTLDNIGKAITTSGGGGEEMNRAADALIKMQNAGKVQADTLNMLSEAGVPIFSGLSEHFGKSMEEVQTMVTEGKVGLEDVLAVTENATGDTFQTMKKASGEVSKSFGNQWKIAKDRVVTSIGAGMVPVMEKLSPLIGKAGEAIAGFIEDFQAGVGPAGKFRDVLESAFGKVKTFLGFVSKHRETLMAMAAGIIAGVVAFKAFMFIKKVTVAIKAARAAMVAFNITMLANPVGILVAAIVLLVGALVYLYRNNEKARKIMDAAWAAIKKAIKFVVDWFVNTAWPMFKQIFTRIGEQAMWLWRNAIKPAFGFIWGIVKKVFGWIKNTGWPMMKVAFEAIAKAAKWLWNNGIKPTFTWIKDKASAVFGWIKNVGWPWLKRAFENIKAKAKWLWDGIKWAFDKIKGGFSSLVDKGKWLRDWIGRYFKAIKNNADWLWDKVKASFDKLKDGVKAVKNAFGDAKDGIGRAWSKVYDKIKSPIVKAMKWLNKNFIGKMQGFLAKIPGISRKTANKLIPTINTKGWSRGGILPGFTPMSRGDDVMTPMRSGEGVLASEGLRDSRSKSMFLAANDAAKRGVSFSSFLGGGYAGGGIVALGKRLQGMGYDVSEHPAFGGVVPGAHSASGYHYKGGALDINADPWNSRFNRETPALDSLNRLLRGEGWNTIWRAPNHFDHLHVDIGNGQGGSGGGLFDMVKSFLPQWAKDLAGNPAGYVRDKVSGLMGKMPGGFGLAGKVLPGLMGKVGSGLGSKVSSLFDIGKLVDKFMPGWMSGGDKGGGGGTDRWRGVVGKALGMLGLPGSAMSATLRRMSQESGGNPRALNNWDSNARNGTPSKGLMQVIDPTFRAYSYPGHNDIWNPLDNVLASMRYAMSRYGSLSSAYNRSGGYASGGLVQPAVFDNGGTLAPGLNLVNNKLGKPEPLVRADRAGEGALVGGDLVLQSRGDNPREDMAEAMFQLRRIKRGGLANA